jgi:uncharacterized protein YndB with AHSA1/START domain
VFASLLSKWWRVAASVEDLRSRVVEAHGDPERPFGCREPVRFEFGATLAVVEECRSRAGLGVSGGRTTWRVAFRRVDSAKSSERACLLIADISGYTTYLTRVEVEHAQDVIADLITSMVEPLHAHFRVNKLEGDAVFLYTPAEEVDGSLLLDLIENSYFAFKRRVRSIERASNCGCGACSLIPQLDVKLVVHHGSVSHQTMLNMDELVGTDVVIVHRLLKNDVMDVTGMKAYALLTESVLRATGLEPELLEMRSHVVELPDIGPQQCWVHDLDTAWRREQGRRRTYVSPADALFSIEQHISGAAPELVWEWMTTPELRSRWEIGLDKIVEMPSAPRRGVGTETHCVHGDQAIVEEVVDWRPPRYVTYRGTLFNGEGVVITDEVVEASDGVIVRKSVQPGSADQRAAVDKAMRDAEPMVSQWLPKMAELIANQMAEQPSIQEPELPRADETNRLATSL